MKTVQVKLGTLAARSLSAAGDSDSERLALLLPRAVRFYLGEGDGAPPGWRYPSFLGNGEGVGEVREIDLDEELWQQLRAEAERQRMEPEELVQHAAFYYGAARDEGRLTERIAEELRLEEEARGAG